MAKERDPMTFDQAPPPDPEVLAKPSRRCRARTPSLSLTCALLVASAPALALVGGEPDCDGRYAAAVTILGGESSGTQCSATKIGDRRFLTAAHCVLDMGSGLLHPTYQRGGLFRISNATAPETISDFVAVRTTTTHVHPEFRAGLHDFLASREERVAELKRSFSGTKLARRIARLEGNHVFTTRFPDVAVIEVDRLTPGIPTADLDLESSVENATVTLVGYGCQSLKASKRRSKGPSYGTRRWADTQVMRVDVINFHSYARRTRADAPTLCPGDSGGPVIYKGKVVGVHGAAFGHDSAGGPRSNMATNLSELRRWEELSAPTPTDGEAASPSPGESRAD